MLRATTSPTTGPKPIRLSSAISSTAARASPSAARARASTHDENAEGARMKFGIFNAMHYRGTTMGRGAAMPPKLFDRAEWQRSLGCNMELFELADDMGFDFVTV